MTKKTLDWKKLTPKITVGLIAILFVVGVAYDVVAIAKGGTGASISHWVITMAYKMPFAVYLTGLVNGILVGHLFWRMRATKDVMELEEKIRQLEKGGH